MDSIDDKDNAGEAEFEILRDAVSSGDGRPPAGRASSGAALAVDVANRCHMGRRRLPSLLTGNGSNALDQAFG